MPNKSVDIFDINTSDTLQLVKIYGIGNVLARRIVNYREALGGFVDKKQLHNVYGLRDSILLALDSLTFIDDAHKPKKIEINQLNIKELSSHPYISYAIAKKLVNYRYQHGNFTDWESLKQIVNFDSTIFIELKPYLSYK